VKGGKAVSASSQNGNGTPTVIAEASKADPPALSLSEEPSQVQKQATAEPPSTPIPNPASNPIPFKKTPPPPPPLTEEMLRAQQEGR